MFLTKESILQNEQTGLCQKSDKMLDKLRKLRNKLLILMQDFKRNLRRTNGNGDFRASMLEEVYHAIRYHYSTLLYVLSQHHSP